MLDIKTYLKEKQAVVNAELERLMDVHDNSSVIHSAMKYAVTAGGKRIRPILCMASWEAAGGADADDRVLLFAAAIEMIHTYSLIHDDLPAMDDDGLRRGRPTIHVKFDEATAVLAGDALLTLAFQTFLSIPQESAPAKWFHAVRLMADAAGYGKMIEGQMRDMEAEGKRLALNELEAVHSLKTGAMITASVCSGAILAGVEPGMLDRLRLYADILGMVFQVVDDILNVKGDSTVMGKAAGTDAARAKNTWPSIMGLEKAEEYAVQMKEKAIYALNGFHEKADPLRAMAEYVVERDR